MTQLDTRQPTRTYRGTIEEVLSHCSEIAPCATVELKVFEPEADSDLQGKTLADVLEEIGSVNGLPAALSINPKYMQGFGETLSCILYNDIVATRR